MSPLPLPIRVAAGLAVVALERARTLPQEVTEWPMTAVSAALQASMRVQQRITELAIKGDEALAGLREPEEDPPWAVFDEDLPARTAAPARSGFDEAVADDDWFDGLGDGPGGPYGAADEPVDLPADLPVPDLDEVTGDAAATRLGDGPGAVPPVVPAALPGYPELTLASVRARLRTLTAADLAALLDYERATADRPEFVRMLTNRIATVRGE